MPHEVEIKQKPSASVPQITDWQGCPVYDRERGRAETVIPVGQTNYTDRDAVNHRSTRKKIQRP